MEASTLSTPASARTGILGRRSPLLKLQGDEKLVALIRDGNEHAFEALFDRYHSRLLAFCRHMLRSAEDAEDVLQEVFVKAHAAMLADERPINARPWLYRIARNRCLNHLRRPVADGVDTMDVLPSENGVTTAERVQKREDFRCLVEDVSDLPETQRTALLLREIDALSYEEIATAMDTTVPAVKSLLVRARMSLAEATRSRQLTCGEVRLELAEAAEGLRKASGPVRHHVKRCEPCREFRGELRSNTKALAALAPLGPLALLWKSLIAKFGIGGSGTAASGSAAGGSGGIAGGSAVAGGGAAAGAGGAAAGVGGAVAAAGGTGAAFGGAAAASGIGGAIGAKAAATAATAALLTAGAVEVRHIYSSDAPVSAHEGRAAAAFSTPPERGEGMAPNGPVENVAAKPAQPAEPTIETQAAPSAASEQAEAPAPATEAPPANPATEEQQAAPADEDELQEAVAGPAAGGAGAASGSGASSADPDAPVVTVTPNPAVAPQPAPSTEPTAAPAVEPATPPTDPAPPPADELDPTGSVPADAVLP